MKVLGISGSPRAGGNTEILVQKALQPFRDAGWTVTEFLLSQKDVKPCRGCETCQRLGQCVIQDDDMNELAAELAGCDAVIIGSPAYYRNVTAQLKAVFDRCFALKGHQPLRDKPGGAIAVARGEGTGQSLVLTIINNFYLSSGAICVPCEMNGLSARADKPGDILAQPNRLRQAAVLGENVRRITERLGRAEY